MKLSLNKPFTLLLLVAAFGAFNVHAQQVTFQGRLAVVSCNATVNSGDNTVSLPLITSDQLPAVGSTVYGRSFFVNVTGCGANPGVLARAYFYSTTTGAVTNGRLNTTPNRGWQFQIETLAGGVVDVGTSTTPPSSSNDFGMSIASGNANLLYTVSYYRSAALTAGNASATANFVLQYI